MKSQLSLIFAVAFVAIFTSPAFGQENLPGCQGRTKTATGPKGTMTVCLDGKYSTCLRDGQRLGNSYDAAKRYCDSLKAKGSVK